MHGEFTRGQEHNVENPCSLLYFSRIAETRELSTTQQLTSLSCERNQIRTRPLMTFTVQWIRESQSTMSP